MYDNRPFLERNKVMNINIIIKLIILSFLLLASGSVGAQTGDGESVLMEEILNQEVVSEAEQEVPVEGVAESEKKEEIEMVEEVVSTETETFAVQYIPVEKVIECIRDVLTEGLGQVQLEGGSNNMMVTDTPLKIQEIAALVKEMDKDERKVAIHTKVLQVALNDEHLMGVDWEATVSDYQRLDLPEQENVQIKEGPFASTMSFGTVSQEDYEELLDALDTVGEMKDILDIKVTVRNARLMQITIDQILSRFLDDEEESFQEEVASFEENIQLQLIPKVVDNEDRLEMKMATVGGAIPRIDAVMQVDNGATIVIGGIFKEVQVAYTKKFPLLGDIPFLGFAFRNQRQRERLSEIIIFLTPHRH